MSRAFFTLMPAPGAASRRFRTAVACVAALTLSACSSGPMAPSTDAVGPSGAASAGGGANLATQQACRQRANEMYEQRNRADLYSASPSTNTPYSGNSYVGVPSRGLSGEFAYGQTVAECERNAATGGPAVAPVAAPAVKSR